MGIVKNKKTKSADTFAARDLHNLRKTPDISSFIQYRLKTGCSLGIAQGRRKGKISL